MKTISFKLGITIITFVIGVVLVGLWFKSKSQEYIVPDVPIVSDVPVVSDATDKYAVYSAALNELFAKDKYQTLIIFNKTSENNSLEELKPNFILAVNYILVDEDEYIKRMEMLAGERNSKSKNNDLIKLIDAQPSPRLSINLSQITFNKERTAAVLHIESKYCPLCGYGKAVSLEKIQGVWEVKNTSETWVS